MEVSGAIRKEQQPQFDALRGNLSMMSKLLDDVVNFGHIHNSKFEVANDPYAFHQVMKSLFVPLGVMAKTRNLTFESELDPSIDILARQASYKAMGAQSEAIRRHINEHPDVSGIVLGDEVRLRQIITSLASNACKFTPAGGKLIIRTKLVEPSIPDGFNPLYDFRDTPDSGSFDATKAKILDQEELGRHVEDVETVTRPTSHEYLTLHSIKHGGKPQEVSETLVIRIEVEDTGCGIKPRDIYVGKPFSNSNQSEQGRQSGGKGAGLGLALVQRLVKISGGRLGVVSKEGQGSIFWVELPVGIGKKTFLTDPLISYGESSTAPSSHNTPIQRPSRQRLRSKDPGCDLLTVLDEPSTRGLGLKKVPPANSQAFATMQGIMEQGGGVDLVSGQRSMLPHHDIALLSANVVAPIPLPPPITSSMKTAPNQGPTFIRVPSPPIFEMSLSRPSLDEDPESRHSNTTASDKSSSQLALFESSPTHNSPSSSFTGIEPGTTSVISLPNVTDGREPTHLTTP
ncbi:hypothetical protein D9619_006725 [Psilocybe cf. subviscida]|uniref:histidine kinase n=1 Tax=Psilocybe cf. subviscida TaxID=2480587 RepID=A0A8H5B4U7_9AGAR|nr:hypothetical protein D9619_006725 [Psilocybe cf. subviscida]